MLAANAQGILPSLRQFGRKTPIGVGSFVGFSLQEATLVVCTAGGDILGLTSSMGDLLLSLSGTLLLIPVGVRYGWIVWSVQLRPSPGRSEPLDSSHP